MKGLLLVELEIAAPLSEPLRLLRNRYAAPPRGMWTVADGGMAGLEAMEAKTAQRWDVHRAEIVRQTPHEAALVARLEVYDAGGARVASRPAVRYGLLSPDGERCTLTAVCLVLGKVVLDYLCKQLRSLTTAYPPRVATWTLFAQEPPPPWLEAAADCLERLGLVRSEPSAEAIDRLNQALAISAAEPTEAAPEPEPAEPAPEPEPATQPTLRRTIRDRRAEVERLRRDGHTVEEIAETLNCGVSTVKRDLAALGLIKKRSKRTKT